MAQADTVLVQAAASGVGTVLAKLNAGTGHAVWGDSQGNLYVGPNIEGKRMLKLVTR